MTGLGHILLDDLNSPRSSRDQTENLWQVPLSINGKDSTRSGPRDFIIDTVSSLSARTWSVHSSPSPSNANLFPSQQANAVNKDGSRKYHLDVQLLSLATKIRFDNSTTPKAIGVEYLQGQSLYAADPRSTGEKNGTAGYVAASKEVIISAGAFNTPQLLKLSGIGPKAELDSTLR